MASEPVRLDPVDELGNYRNWGKEGTNVHTDKVVEGFGVLFNVNCCWCVHLAFPF